MTAQGLREKYLEFFRDKGHAVIPSAPLLPENDPSTLFISAGMQPLVPYLLGEKHPAGQRLVNVQKCLRTGDIEEVGDATHHTFFEMLGNWSLGDYFKKEAIEMSWDFLTSKKWLGLDKERLAVSVFGGDGENKKDEEAKKIWLDLGMPAERIVELGKEDNWWPAGGKNAGPQGPDTEMFYFTGEGAAPTRFDPEDKRWVEIWNDVFMEFKKTDSGYENLAQKNVDTGMGLERTLAVLNGFNDNYRTELFWPLIKKIEELSGRKYEGNEREMRLVADHVKAAVLIIADGIEPAKNGAGYVLRRLIRRASYYFGLMGAENGSLGTLTGEVAKIYKDVYPELLRQSTRIDKVIRDEENVFVAHLIFGRKFLEKIISENKHISGDDAFLLYSTYGFPFELILEIAEREGAGVDKEDFERKKLEHQELSRTAAAGMFKGGLADTSEKTVKLHTAAHLMLEALRRVLGSHLEQRGSNITPERLRFDISHPEKLTVEQITKVEQLVNEQIKKDLPVRFKEMSQEEAKSIGATGVFEHKYGEQVKVYFIGEGEDNFSKEICGGPHVTRTGELGKFRIVKEESSSAGTRRVKAVLE